MSEIGSNAVDAIVQSVIDAVDRRLDGANFDKSQTGVVTAVNGNEYTISVFGSKYTIVSDQIFTVGQSVVVTALQGDMKRLVCSPDNIGTMKTVDSHVKTVNERLSSFIDTDFADTVNRVDDIKDQVDNSFMSWFYDGTPTIANAPAKDWTTDDAKRLHIGDLYYDTMSGYSYEWVLSNGEYAWIKITQSGIQDALKNASKAQSTADGKIRMFYNTPSPPYDVGDMWSQGEDGDLLICRVARVITDSYNRNDWVIASKYTDDTVANRAEEKADKAQEGVDSVKDALDSFKKNYSSDFTVTDESIKSIVESVTNGVSLDGKETAIQRNATSIENTDEKVSLIATTKDLENASESKSLFQVTSDKITSEVSNAKSELSSQITQTTNTINLEIAKKLPTEDFTEHNIVSKINLNQDSVKINANKIELDGAVTISDGKTVLNSDAVNNSITEIDGGKIKTGTLTADKISADGLDAGVIKTGKLSAEHIDLSGDLTLNDDGKIIIGDNVITANNLAKGATSELIWQNNDVESSFKACEIKTDISTDKYSQYLIIGFGKTSGGSSNFNPVMFSAVVYDDFIFSNYQMFCAFPESYVSSTTGKFNVSTNGTLSAVRYVNFGGFFLDYKISIMFSSAYRVSSDGYTTQDDDYIIPYKIYGIK